MTEQDVRERVMESMMGFLAQEKEKKLRNYRQQNAFVRKGQTLFTGSSLME